ncbi:OVARIAN TUMOR DOMAIN-containing deubiquitinating enzyme 9 isoform X2 [Populus alba]|uniref:OVARIAN TUMOR DOMAIN-containing deubiquitinating enzyme 9 isoform X2 n=1 Tax=Populus alba TaxID=43335 RepID=UPI00158A7DF1|nr:OVARIAN TUMOR DOMAIN-containing deubiquitinating enzyme 9-like isoform X2 [Populus alba]
MIVFEQDPDVVRWGLHNLIHDCTLPNSGSCYAVTRHDRDTFNAGYVREYYNDPEYANNVENDAVIARALQEELSRIADAEAFGLNNAEQESIIMQQWPCSHERYHGSEHKNNQEVTNDHCENKTGADNHSKNVADDSSKDETAIPTSCSKSVEDSPNMEELAINSNLANEYALDGEVGKRISDMVPIPLVPKTNGEIPSEDAETSDHQRLLDRLKVYDLVENKVPGDGNCQFRSLSDQLYRSPEHHKLVREHVIDQLKSQPQMYEGYVPMAYDDYLKKMSKGGEWGDHITLQAAADSYGVKIFVITSFKDTCYLEILPQAQKSDRVIFLSFWAEVHYNSIYSEGVGIEEKGLVEDLQLGTSSANLIRRRFCAPWKAFSFHFHTMASTKEVQKANAILLLLRHFQLPLCILLRLDLTAIVPSFVLCPDLFIIFRSCFRLF